MEYALYTFEFSTDVHFGINALDNCEISYRADTLFSALCHEALKIGEIEKLYQMAKLGKVAFSDMMPFIGDTYFVPKPFYNVESKAHGDSVAKKKFKTMIYIPVDRLKNFMAGTMDPDSFSVDELGEYRIRTQAAVRVDGDTVPFRIATYHFRTPEENNGQVVGLYLIIGYEDEEHKSFLEELLDMLQCTGIGGERYNGLGKYTMYPKKIPTVLEQGLKMDAKEYLSLSISMPCEEELESVLEGASYRMVKRSGFVESATYGDRPLKKKDFYAFEAGSCFKERFKGDIFDVSNRKGGDTNKHPVYRYAKPMLLGVK